MIETLRRHYLTQPFEVSIETLALCNAACGFCPYPSLERKGTRMPDEVIESLIEQMASWSQSFYVSPFKVSEPLLDARMADICHTIENRVPQAHLRLFSNGAALTTRHLKWIAALKRLDHLWVSLNATHEAEHAQIMGMGPSAWPRIVAHLDELHRACRDRMFEHAVIVSRVAQGTHVDDAAREQSFAEFVHGRWPLFTPLTIKRDGWLGHIDPSSPEVPQAPCSRWFELSIAATGKAVLCCMDGTGEYVLGDVTQRPLLDIYNDSTLTRRRARAMTRRGIDPCERCTY